MYITKLWNNCPKKHRHSPQPHICMSNMGRPQSQSLRHSLDAPCKMHAKYMYGTKKLGFVIDSCRTYTIWAIYHCSNPNKSLSDTKNIEEYTHTHTLYFFSLIRVHFTCRILFSWKITFNMFALCDVHLTFLCSCCQRPMENNPPVALFLKKHQGGTKNHQEEVWSNHHLIYMKTKHEMKCLLFLSFKAQSDN